MIVLTVTRGIAITLPPALTKACAILLPSTLLGLLMCLANDQIRLYGSFSYLVPWFSSFCWHFYPRCALDFVHLVLFIVNS